MLELVILVIAGVLVVDICLDVLRTWGDVQRRRQRERDRAAVLRTIDRTGGPR